MRYLSSQNLGPASGRPVPLLTPELSARFWTKVEKTDSCWLWTASVRGDGYGQFAAYKTVWAVHRIAYRQLVGQIPEGLTLDHLCRNRLCVNPAHLEPVTAAENLARVDRKPKTHCIRGHEFTPENTYLRPDNGKRQCKACQRARERRWRGVPPALTALLTGALLLTAPATSQAVQLGISDSQATIEQRNEWAGQINASWERLIVSVDQPGVAERIRESHAAGRKIILTVGGIGTRSRRPSFKLALRYIHTLPRADRYTIDNEPFGDGTKPCTYLRGWTTARKVLGSRLLFLDGDPFYPARYIKQMVGCRGARLPARIDLAIHPYTWQADPLRRGKFLGEMGSLPKLLKVLRHMHVKATPWITEFGVAADSSIEDGPMVKTGSLPVVTDEDAARFWPRAILQARRVHARVLIIYMAQGPTWDTRPGEQAWAAIRSRVS